MTSLFDLEQNPPVDLADAARERYLHYAVSVITSRALPDARDGLKPVQRRILYTMWHNLRLRSDARYRKSAKVVGEVMGSYHPHGDQAIYDALVRLAQPWSMRHPLVDGSGNFGSLDGDPAAAMRYTECRLAGISAELLEEIGQDTVDFRDNYDSTAREPQVLPARFPCLLVSGATGIAVGMATSIPPHNLGEVTTAAVALIKKRRTDIAALLDHVQGPDFPTGGTVRNTREELLEIYTRGQGSIRIQGDTVVEKLGRGKRAVVVTSIPYMVSKSSLVEKIGELIGQRKVPQLVDVRDESTTDVRIVCELSSGSSPDAAIAYLYKHTPLRTTFSVNLTALVPGSKPGVTVPERLSLRDALLHFIDFRYVTVRRRLEHELSRLRERIHVLEGFAIVFDALDEAIRIIRKSEGKPDAAKKLSKRFGLDDTQTEAILEIKLYRLARMEIERILAELEEKRASAAKIEKLLSSTKRMWTLVEKELAAVAATHGDRRRTTIGGVKAEEIEFDPEAYIESSDTYVVVTRDGWVKRQQSIRDPKSVRMREGDEVLAIAAGNTRECVSFLSSLGVAYVIRINDIPATTGYGEPIQKLFKFADGERVVAALSLDPRFPMPRPARKSSREDPDPPYLLAISARGLGSRFSLAGHLEPSTRSGRRFARVKKGDEIVSVSPVDGSETCITASSEGRVLLCPVAEIKLLGGPGTGVIVHKLEPEDRLVGAAVVARDFDGVQIETNRGAVEWIRPNKYRVTSRAGRGFEYIKRGSIKRMIRPEPIVPEFPD